MSDELNPVTGAPTASPANPSPGDFHYEPGHVWWWTNGQWLEVPTDNPVGFMLSYRWVWPHTGPWTRAQALEVFTKNHDTLAADFPGLTPEQMVEALVEAIGEPA